MKSALRKESAVDDEIRMGSEYSTARAYLGRLPKARTPHDVPTQGSTAVKDAPARGSNDSDFGSFGQ